MYTVKYSDKNEMEKSVLYSSGFLLTENWEFLKIAGCPFIEDLCLFIYKIFEAPIKCDLATYLESLVNISPDIESKI